MKIKTTVPEKNNNSNLHKLNTTSHPWNMKVAKLKQLLLKSATKGTNMDSAIFILPQCSAANHFKYILYTCTEVVFVCLFFF